ncbi:sugar transferase [Amylibacter sp. IMCC11727]|uniref:sugar transferase n=1 Tax=Amylibacter sp. IMCC11727 TaxID=3039851 RepID=UPI00244E30BB|nr:sugar transferase [Amylibacter sp. IMCC11727]WGI22121.1 sugar transferase [Amylibacter sp. IMCC11727]
MKRLFDFVSSFLGLLLLSPILIVLGVLIWLPDRGPVFYRQIRVGRNCKPFGMLKFRSMVRNADQIGGYQTHAGDPRITKIGRILRKTSLDELPQLINVLLGDMSLVGPRPDVPAQESLYSAQDWQKRHSVRPGITGLAQVTGRSSVDFETRLGYDLEYVETQSLMLDLKLLVKTVGVATKSF